MEKILVTGATGHLGNIVVENLLKKVSAGQISILVRDESKAQALKAKGVTVNIGSYQDIHSLNNAMKGIDKVLLISSSDFNDRIGQHKNVVDAAKQAGVKHILYTGVALKDIAASPLQPLLQDHFQTEDYIKASGLSFTFLQNSLYAEVIPMFVGEDVLKTGIFFPAGEGKVPFAVRKDLGEAIAIILAGEGHENKTYHLTASKTYSFADIAAELTTLSGKKVNYTSPEDDAFEDMLKQFGLPEEIVLMSVLFAKGIKNNDFNMADGTLESILGREQTDLRMFLKEAFNL
ncbi:NAD(P)H-binding protein [Labilibaculum sp. A4]|uniref:SDR family oxidoreductase n=1 Tax=Labilibaculum euxinus TaxID=2686357 RepID=UPI000F61B9F7|nr:SDR family oxidoreductase [Labilibaculum euxinus]MDQ1771975.1 SDR family oxidoreductase [Labilibaculum euxinus]MWN75674.1 NAD(P)H-binding protein [Labilibaculum euxinus]